MDKQTRKNIDSLANSVYKLLVQDPELSLEESLESAGIDVRYFSDKDYDGFLMWDAMKKQPVISVNATQPLVRRNFSMAHELGHLIINWGWIPFSSNNQFSSGDKVLNVTKYRGATYNASEKREETMVNEFAAGFLIPDDLLTKIILENDINQTGYRGLVDKIAQRFQVSVQAADIRLNNFLDLAVDD